MSSEDAGQRVDVVAAGLSGLTRSQVYNLVDKGLLTVNSTAVKQNYRVRAGDNISIVIIEKRESLLRENIPLEILHMDDSVAVVNKPAGMVVYPAAGHVSGTLLNALAYHSNHLASVGGPLRPGVVHRLDKDTSGVMVIALDDKAYYDLVEQFRARTVRRRYTALVYGNLKNDEGRIFAKIGRSESDRKKMSTKAHRGKEALTTWKVLERLTSSTLVEAVLGTGRTHQIRVHFASVGHPVLGDRTYGKKTCIEVLKRKVFFPRQMLHAGILGFVHPASGAYMEFSCRLPGDMQATIGELRHLSKSS